MAARSRSRLSGRVGFADITNLRLVDYFQHAFDIFFAISVAKPEHPITQAAQRSIANLTFHPMAIVAVLAAARLHDYGSAAASKSV